MPIRSVIANALSAFARAFDPSVANAQAYPEPDSGKDMPDFAAWLMGQAIGLPPVALDAENVLRKVALMRACVLRRANDLAMVPIVFERQNGEDWTPIERRTGNIVDVWNRANPSCTSFELLRDWVADEVGTGNGYLLADWNGRKSGSPGELWVMKSHNVEVIEGRRRTPAEYVFNRGTRERVDAEKVLHLKGWNPSDHPLGASASESLEFEYTARYDATRVISALMKSGGLPAGFLRPDPPGGMGAVAGGLTPERAHQLEKRLNRGRGVGDWFKRRVLTGPMKWERASLTPAELQLLEITDRTDRVICAAFGVFPSMLGLSAASSGTIGAASAVSTTERENYLDFTLMPDARRVELLLTEKLCPMFAATDGLRVRARFDFSGHPTMVDRQMRHGDALQKIAGGPIVTTNEARKQLGQVPSPDPLADEIRSLAPPPAIAPPEIKPTSTPAPMPEPKPAPVSQRLARRVTLASAVRRGRVRLKHYEASFAKDFRAIFSAQEARVVTAVTHTFTFAAKGDVNAALDVDLEDRDAVQALFERLVSARGLEAAADVASELEIDIHDAAASAFVRASTDAAIRRTTETTRNALRTSLADGIAAGESMGDLVKRVHEVFDARRDNALTIARTETVRAYNWAATWAWSQTPEVTHVQWKTAGDDAVRDAHAGIDGETRPMGDPFEMTNPETGATASVEYPGDLNAPGWATINCRCILVPLSPEDVQDAQETQFARFWGTNGTNRIAAYANGGHAHAH